MKTKVLYVSGLSRTIADMMGLRNGMRLDAITINVVSVSILKYWRKRPRNTVHHIDKQQDSCALTRA